MKYYDRSKHMLSLWRAKLRAVPTRRKQLQDELLGYQDLAQFKIHQQQLLNLTNGSSQGSFWQPRLPLVLLALLPSWFPFRGSRLLAALEQEPELLSIKLGEIPQSEPETQQDYVTPEHALFELNQALEVFTDADGTTEENEKELAASEVMQGILNLKDNLHPELYFSLLSRFLDKTKDSGVIRQILQEVYSSGDQVDIKTHHQLLNQILEKTNDPEVIKQIVVNLYSLRMKIDDESYYKTLKTIFEKQPKVAFESLIRQEASLEVGEDDSKYRFHEHRLMARTLMDFYVYGESSGNLHLNHILALVSLINQNKLCRESPNKVKNKDTYQKDKNKAKYQYKDKLYLELPKKGIDSFYKDEFEGVLELVKANQLFGENTTNSDKSLLIHFTRLAAQQLFYDYKRRENDINWDLNSYGRNTFRFIKNILHFGQEMKLGEPGFREGMMNTEIVNAQIIPSQFKAVENLIENIVDADSPNMAIEVAQKFRREHDKPNQFILDWTMDQLNHILPQVTQANNSELIDKLNCILQADFYEINLKSNLNHTNSFEDDFKNLENYLAEANNAHKIIDFGIELQNISSAVETFFILLDSEITPDQLHRLEELIPQFAQLSITLESLKFMDNRVLQKHEKLKTVSQVTNEGIFSQLRHDYDQPKSQELGDDLKKQGDDKESPG